MLFLRKIPTFRQVLLVSLGSLTVEYRWEAAEHLPLGTRRTKVGESGVEQQRMVVWLGFNQQNGGLMGFNQRNMVVEWDLRQEHADFMWFYQP